MKVLKHSFRILFLSLLLALVVPNILPVPGQIAQVEAAARLSKKSATLIKGQTLTLKVTGTNKTIKWSSSDKAVATVSSKGKVKAKGTGTATITAKAGKKKYTCKITVQSPSFSKSTVTLTKGATKSLALNGTDQKITWKSSNAKVAAVNQKGKITAKKAGTAIITATVLKKSFTCKIIVKNASASSSGTSSSSTSGTVWIPKTGSKYHRISTCSNMKNPSQVSLEEAIKRGYEPCKKCY